MLLAFEVNAGCTFELLQLGFEEVKRSEDAIRGPSSPANSLPEGDSEEGEMVKAGFDFFCLEGRKREELLLKTKKKEANGFNRDGRNGGRGGRDD